MEALFWKPKDNESRHTRFQSLRKIDATNEGNRFKWIIDETVNHDGIKGLDTPRIPEQAKMMSKLVSEIL